jgi:predicted nucleic acid-binding protein
MYINEEVIYEDSLIHRISETCLESLFRCRDTKILETYPLRAMDVLHISCAVEWEADLFVSSDKKQIHAAEQAGLKTKLIL